MLSLNKRYVKTRIFQQSDVQPLQVHFLPTKGPLLDAVVEADRLIFCNVLDGLKEQDVSVSSLKLHHAVEWLHVVVFLGVRNQSPLGFQRRVALAGEGLRIDADFLAAMFDEKQVAQLVLILCHLPALSTWDHLSMVITQDGALPEGLGCNNPFLLPKVLHSQTRHPL